MTTILPIHCYYHRVKGRNVRFYDVPSTFSNQNRSLGRGKRSDFTKSTNDFPGPGSYSKLTRSDQGLAYSFTCIGRNKGGKYQLKTERENRKNEPGPGWYTFRDSEGTPAPKFGTEERPRSITPDRSDEPGPGTYMPKIDRKGREIASKHGYCTTLKPEAEKKFREKAESRIRTPGPGSYFPDLETTGRKQPNSRVRNSSAFGFGSGRCGGSFITPQTEKRESPGPGNYRVPSDFGHYVSKYALDDDGSSNGFKSARRSSSHKKLRGISPILRNVSSSRNLNSFNCSSTFRPMNSTMRLRAEIDQVKKVLDVSTALQEAGNSRSTNIETEP